MLYKTLSAAVYGVDASIIEVEVDVSGIKTPEDHFHTVGLLDGGVRGVRGALPIAIEARGKKISRLVVPELNAREAAMVAGVEVYPVRSLLDVIRFVNTGNGIQPLKVDGDTLLSELQHFAAL